MAFTWTFNGFAVGPAGWADRWIRNWNPPAAHPVDSEKISKLTHCEKNANSNRKSIYYLKQVF